MCLGFNPNNDGDVLRGLNPWFTESKEGAAALRDLRRHRAFITDSFEANNPLDSLSHFGPGVFPYANKNRIYPHAAIEKIDALIRGSRRPARASEQDWMRLQELRGAVRQDWVERIYPQLWDADARRFRDVSIDALDDMLFQVNADQPMDLRRWVDNLSSRISQAEAKRMNFDPRRVPAALRVQQFVKGNLAHLWMTTSLGYHVNNLFGNQVTMAIAALRSESARRASVLFVSM